MHQQKVNLRNLRENYQYKIYFFLKLFVELAISCPLASPILREKRPDKSFEKNKINTRSVNYAFKKFSSIHILTKFKF